MKINPLTSAIRLFSQVAEREPEQGGGYEHSQRHSKQEQNPSENPEEVQVEVTAENVNHAIEAFAKELEGKGGGLTASAEGAGPGLKVVLKDASGSVIRQFTGEEFLKLRGKSSRDAHRRGKILDQKL